ncbi:MAG: hypothetical protein ACOYYS_26050 [Chloroflexota bacterium]
MLRKYFRGRGGQSGRGSGQGGRGQGGGNRPGSGPGGNCVCPKCGKTVPHTVGQRCMDISCPNCGTRMVKA